MDNNPKFSEYLDMKEFSIAPEQVLCNEDLLLIGGDFCGIQKYIYKISSKHASHSLKGRSFYLRLLSDAIVRFLLDNLSLSSESVVYNSGGSFYLTAPDNQEIRQKIEESAMYIEKCLFDAHGTDLYLALDYVEFPLEVQQGSGNKSLPQVWTELFNRRRQQKNHKFSRLLTSTPECFFTSFMKGGESLRDDVTGEELDSKHAVSSGELKVSPITWAQIELGKALQTCDVMLVTDMPVQEMSQYPHITPANLKHSYYFVKSANRAEWESIATGVLVDEIELRGAMRRVVPFEQLCANDGLERLGVLRMDVDNLGKLFQQGISAECASLKRYALLSHKFDYFFTDYLYDIYDTVAPHNAQVIYSGGDDVFIVGSWDATIELARKIREDFRIYTKEDERFSISGGIAILNPKYPIIKGAEESAEEEHRAKEHQVNLGSKCLSKNSISFLGMPLNWDTEFPIVEQLKNDILGMLNLRVLNKSFLSKVMRHAGTANFKNHQVQNYKTYWMMAYDLSRMKQSSKDPDVKKLIENCILESSGKSQKLGGVSIQTNYHPLELWQLACRWAELEYRTY